MRTERTFTSQGRRAQIVAATVQVIAHDGLSQASFARIAAAAGLSSPGMISYHFVDKDELFSVLCDTVLGDCLAVVEDAVSAAAGPAEGVAAYVAAFVRWQDQHRDEVAALWRLSAGWKRPGEQVAFDEAPLREPLLRVLRDGQASGVLRPLREDWVAHTILCAVEGYQQALLQDPDLDSDEYARTLVEVFGRGLLAA
jgi:AcrR family transcriptional regulator